VALARRGVDLFPFTPLGLVTTGAAALALWRYGVKRVDLLYLVIGAVGLGLTALSLVFTVLAAIRVRLALRRFSSAENAGQPLRLECGARAPTGFSLPSLWYLPMVRARWSWTRPEAGVRSSRSGGRVHEDVVPARRGHEESIERRVEVADAFALTRIAFLHREPRPVRVAPSTGALDRIRLSRSIAGGDDLYDPLGAPDGERIDLRGYAPGDPIRFVLWKVFAKTRQLIVRTPERALSPARRAVSYVATGRGDEAAAGVARRAVETGALGASFVLGADGVAEDARSADEALELLAHSASADEAEGGAGLARFLARASPVPGARAIVFVPAFRGPWTAHVLAALRTKNSMGRAPMQVVVCADGIDRRRRPSLAKRLLVGAVRGHEERPAAHDVEALLGTLASAGADVLLVDRRRGQVYAGTHVLRDARSEPVPVPAPVPVPETSARTGTGTGTGTGGNSDAVHASEET
jgi:uncharacterized protein (DUF58 family)